MITEGTKIALIDLAERVDRLEKLAREKVVDLRNSMELQYFENTSPANQEACSEALAIWQETTNALAALNNRLRVRARVSASAITPTGATGATP